jgi:hypothetical protein
MEHPDFDFISGWSTRRRQQLRSIVIQAVLATDMSKHFEILTQFQTKVVNAEGLQKLGSPQKWAAMDSSQKILTLQMAMKVRTALQRKNCVTNRNCVCAVRHDVTLYSKHIGVDSTRRVWLLLPVGLQVSDLGACALPLIQHKQWNERLKDEFFRQVGLAALSRTRLNVAG